RERARDAEDEPGQRVDPAANHAAHGHGPGGDAVHLVIADAHGTALPELAIQSSRVPCKANREPTPANGIGRRGTCFLPPARPRRNPPRRAHRPSSSRELAAW